MGYQDQLNLASNVWGDDHSRMTDGHVTMFRIFEVNADARTCGIKTFGSDPLVSNAEYVNVQWLSDYSHPDGDESSLVPRIGALGISIFSGGQPWILGYFSPITLDPSDEPEDLEGEGISGGGGSAGGNKEKLNPGDRIFRTIGDCRIVLRAGGELEFEATKICKRVMFPTRNLIHEVCQNYEFRADGGSIDWVHQPGTQETYYEQIWKDDIRGTNLIVDERGTVDGDIIHRYQIRGGGAANPLGSLQQIPPAVFKEITNLGKTTFQINKAAFEYTIEPDGTYTFGIGDKKYLNEIKPNGEWHVNINGVFDHIVKDSGEVTVNISDKYKLNILPTGATSLNIADKCQITIADSGATIIDIGPGSSTISIDPGGNISIKASSEVTCEAPNVNLNADFVNLGSGASDVVPMGKLLVKELNKFIANYKAHSHISPFLGIPTTPPVGDATMALVESAVLSETVKVQK